MTLSSTDKCATHSDPCLYTSAGVATMDDDTGDEALDDERSLELSTVAAIYPELVVSTGTEKYSASLEINVEPIPPLPICFPAADGAPPGLPTPPDSLEAGVRPESDPVEKGSIQDIHRLSYLPPLSLRIALPDGYPSEKPPIISLESQCPWLPAEKVQELCTAGRSLWEDMGRDQVVFSYIDHLREAAEKGFHLAQGKGKVLEVSADLKVALLDYDLKAKRAKFEQETFECGICLGRVSEC